MCRTRRDAPDAWRSILNALRDRKSAIVRELHDMGVEVVLSEVSAEPSEVSGEPLLATPESDYDCDMAGT
jgi:hypothetical protein